MAARHESVPEITAPKRSVIMTIAITVVVSIVVLLAAVLAYAATRPDTFRVQRSTSVQAPPEKIFPLVNNFHAWEAWSPYEKLDPTMKRTFSGAPNGKGAAYAWSGSGKAGEGRMEITDTSPPNKILIKLDFTKPFKSSNTTEYTFAPAGDATTVTWAMHGPNLFIGKVMGLFFNMDTMIGKDFETGLANLKAVAERGPAAVLPTQS